MNWLLSYYTYVHATTVFLFEISERGVLYMPSIDVTSTTLTSRFVVPSAGMLPLSLLCNNSKMRWALAAHDICFTSELHSIFFALGQNVPVIRGEGVYQRGMDYCVDLLNLGKWV